MGLRKGLKKGLRQVEKNVVRPVASPVVHGVVQPVVNAVVQPVVQPVVNAVVQPVVQPVVNAVVQPVVNEVVKPVVKEIVRHGLLPIVVGAGRKKVTTSHVVTDFQSESITLMVTVNGEVEIQEVTSPCADGDHEIVECEQPLEIQLNDGSYVFNDKFCTKCGEHFPYIP